MYSKSIIADGNDLVRVSWVAGMRFDAILCPSVSPVSSALHFNRRSPHRRREHLRLLRSRGARTHNERIGDVDLLIHKSILNESRARNKLHSFLAIGKRTIYISRGVKIFWLNFIPVQFLICIGGARRRASQSRNRAPYNFRSGAKTRSGINHLFCALFRTRAGPTHSDLMRFLSVPFPIILGLAK